MTDSGTRKTEQFIVRLPEGMRDRIKRAAEANNRSMNAEVVATLEEKYPGRRAPDDFESILEVYADVAARAAAPDISDQDRAALKLELEITRNYILKEVGIEVEPPRSQKRVKDKPLPTISIKPHSRGNEADVVPERAKRA